MNDRLFPHRIFGITLLPAVAWLMIWLGINTGYWVLYETPTNLLGWAHYIRTLFPAIVLLTVLLFRSGEQHGLDMPKCIWAWLWYGVIGLAVSWMSPDPLGAVYWAVCYLSVFAALVLYLDLPQPIERIVELNRWTWIIATVFVLIMLAVARDYLMEQAASGGTGYGVGHGQGVAGVGVSISSGMARFLAVPGLVAFVYALASSGALRIGWAVVAAACGVLLFFFQSRGAILGYSAAVLFALLMYRSMTRYMAVGLLGCVVLLATIFPGSEDWLQHIEAYVSRGETAEGLSTLTGRTREWALAAEFIQQSPIWGWGFQADRYLLSGDHVHNTYIYATLTGGLLGAGAFVFGLGHAWWAFFRVLGRVPSDQRLVLIQTGALLAFFTVRSIPEVSGAMFGVDLMVMLPAIAYIGILDRQYTSLA